MFDGDDAEGGAHAGLQGGAGGGFGKKIHVVEAGDAAAQHLGAGKQGAVIHKGVGYQPVFCRPDVILQPCHQRQVVGDAAQQGHGGMRVQIHQPGDQRMVWKFNDIGIRIALTGGVRRQQFNDTAIPDDDGMPFEYSAGGFDWNDPAGLNQGGGHGIRSR